VLPGHYDGIQWDGVGRGLNKGMGGDGDNIMRGGDVLLLYYTCICNARTFSSGTESEALAVNSNIQYRILSYRTRIHEAKNSSHQSVIVNRQKRQQNSLHIDHFNNNILSHNVQNCLTVRIVPYKPRTNVRGAFAKYQKDFALRDFGDLFREAG